MLLVLSDVFVVYLKVKHPFSKTQKINILFFKEDKKRGEFQKNNSEIRPKKSRSSVQILPQGLFWPFASFYLHPVFGYEKPPETLVGSGDFVCASFLYRHLGCGGRIWTYDLRVMSPTSYQAAPLRDMMVPEAGVEPVRDCSHGILSPGRLPIPPFRQVFAVFRIALN